MKWRIRNPYIDIEGLPEKDALATIIFEGIDYDSVLRRVSFTDKHEDNVNTSVLLNPTCRYDLIPGVPVWSVFQRTDSQFGDKDGNPLIYAMKNENGWSMSRGDYKKIESNIKQILIKFFDKHGYDATIILPSTSVINPFMEKLIKEVNPECKIINDLVIKMTIKEVDDDIMKWGSPFRKAFPVLDDLRVAYAELEKNFERMRREKNGEFTYHFIDNKKIRNAIEHTLKLEKNNIGRYSGLINNKNVLLVDDTIRRGNTIKDAIRVIKDTFEPKSLTALTMFSALSLR